MRISIYISVLLYALTQLFSVAALAQQLALAPAGDCLPENFFGSPLRINVRGVEEIHSRVETYVDQACGFGHIGRPPSFEKVAFTAKCRRSEAEHRHLQT